MSTQKEKIFLKKGLTYSLKWCILSIQTQTDDKAEPNGTEDQRGFTMKKKYEVRHIVTAVASIPVYKINSKMETYRQAAKDGWGTVYRDENNALVCDEDCSASLYTKNGGYFGIFPYEEINTKELPKQAACAAIITTDSCGVNFWAEDFNQIHIFVTYEESGLVDTFRVEYGEDAQCQYLHHFPALLQLAGLRNDGANRDGGNAGKVHRKPCAGIPGSVARSAGGWDVVDQYRGQLRHKFRPAAAHKHAEQPRAHRKESAERVQAERPDRDTVASGFCSAKRRLVFAAGYYMAQNKPDAGKCPGQVRKKP